MLLEMIAARETARPMPDDRMTVGKWLVTWLKAQEARGLRPNTLRAYERNVRLLLPELGSIPARKLRSTTVETILQAFPPATAAGIRSVLSTAIKDAMRAGHVQTNEAALARAPRTAKRKLVAPDTATVRAILSELEGHRLSALYVLLAGTGLRIGEATGLRWEDVDGLSPRDDGRGTGPVVQDSDAGGTASVQRSDAMGRATDGARIPGRDAVRIDGDGGVRGGAGGGTASLTVRYQLQRINGEHVLTDPKTDTAGRIVHLPPVLQAALRSHKARQAAERLAAGRKWRKADLVFTTAEGEPVAESTAQWVLSQACKRAGVRHVSPHDLRRYVASQLADALGRDAAQRVLGHSAPMQTEGYITTRDAMLARAADAMEAALA